VSRLSLADAAAITASLAGIAERPRGRDPVLDRCHRCGRFVPEPGRGGVVYDPYMGGYEAVEGRCPLGFGCAS
jgi:hypothetical protein